MRGSALYVQIDVAIRRCICKTMLRFGVESRIFRHPMLKFGVGEPLGVENVQASFWAVVIFDGS